ATITDGIQNIVDNFWGRIVLTIFTFFFAIDISIVDSTDDIGVDTSEIEATEAVQRHNKMLLVKVIPVEEFAPGKEVGINILSIFVGHIQQWLIGIALGKDPVALNILLPVFDPTIRDKAIGENTFILTDSN